MTIILPTEPAQEMLFLMGVEGTTHRESSFIFLTVEWKMGNRAGCIQSWDSMCWLSFQCSKPHPVSMCFSCPHFLIFTSSSFYVMFFSPSSAPMRCCTAEVESPNLSTQEMAQTQKRVHKGWLLLIMAHLMCMQVFVCNRLHTLTEVGAIYTCVFLVEVSKMGQG